MARIPIDRNAFPYPMPMVVVGALVDERPNFLAVAWVTRVNYRPPMIAVALGRSHFTNAGIRATGAFSVSVPGVDLMQRVDYCGLISGRDQDKSDLFRVVTGPVTGTPMVDECPLCMECRLSEIVALPSNDLFVGEIVAAYAEEGCCTNGRPDIRLMRPFTLTMPDNQYWEAGECVGRAWSEGRNYRRP